MTQFHEGQEVEVREIADGMNEMHWSWRKAKIAEIWTIDHCKREYTVQFADGACAVFDVAQIRAPLTEKQKAIGRRMHREFEGRGL